MSVYSVLVFLFFFLPPFDTDLGWYIRLGEEFFTSGTIPTANDLTYYLAGYRVGNPYPLYSILVAFVYRYTGLWGLAILNSVVMTLCYWIFQKIVGKLKLLSFVSFAAISLLAWTVFSLGIRAQLFSFLFFLLVLCIFKKAYSKIKYLFFLPLVFFFWANLHGAFVLGLIIVAVFWGDVLFRRKYKLAIYLGAVYLVSVLIVAVNAYGFSLYGRAVEHFQAPLATLIAEWVPPNFPTRSAIVVLLVVTLVLAVARRSISPYLPLLIIFSFLYFQARRNASFYWLSLILVYADYYWGKLLKIEKSRVAGSLKLPVMVVSLFLLVIGQMPVTIKAISNHNSFCNSNPATLPCEVVTYLKQNPLTVKNIYTAYEWGGYLEWQLPEYKYFVDGRMPAWPTPEGKSPYTMYLEIIQAKPGYQQMLEKYGTEALLIGSGTFLDLELKKGENDNWQEVYRDEVAVLYIGIFGGVGGSI